MDASSIDPEHIIGTISMSATSSTGIYSRAGESEEGDKVAGCVEIQIVRVIARYLSLIVKNAIDP